MISANPFLKTALLALFAATLVYILRRPDLYFSLEALKEAISKNVVALFTVLPAILAYALTNVISHNSSGTRQVETLPSLLSNYARCSAIIIIACAIVSAFADVSYCDESGYDCTDASPPAKSMMNFMRTTIAALTGMVVALIQQREQKRWNEIFRKD